MKLKHAFLGLLCLIGLSGATTTAQAQYYAGPGAYAYYPGYHGGYYGGGYPVYHGGYYGGCYGYHGGYYGGGYNYGNSTGGIISAVACLVGAIGNGVAANRAIHDDPVVYSQPASYQAPSHVTIVNQAPRNSSSSSKASSSASAPIPHGYATTQGTIRSPWSNSQVPSNGISSGTVLFDSYTGQRYTAP